MYNEKAIVGMQQGGAVSLLSRPWAEGRAAARPLVGERAPSATPVHVIDIFLQPGEYYFGGMDTRIRTVLGSCVSLVFWHPERLIGGMCHYMLPSRASGKLGGLDGRYADEAVALMLREMRVNGTRPDDYQVKIFGGGNMFPGSSRNALGHVGMRNVEAARRLVKAHGLVCHSEHLEGVGHRNVIFDVWSGHVWVKHQPPGCNVEGGPGCLA